MSSAWMTACGSGASVKTVGMPSRAATAAAAMLPTSAIRRCSTSTRPCEVRARRIPRSAATETGPGPTTTPSPGAGTPLLDAQGRTVGAVATEQTDQGLAFRITATGMEPGFHGLHLHQIGKCEPNSPDPSDPSKTGAFLSSGGHLGDGDHPNHSGDLPSLLVGQDGSGSLTVVSQRLTREQLADGDGTALVVHAGPDNYANIPTRYASAGPDDETKKAGDAGRRVACAVVGG